MLNRVRTLYHWGQALKEEYNKANNAIRISHLEMEIQKNILSFGKTEENVDSK